MNPLASASGSCEPSGSRTRPADQHRLQQTEFPTKEQAGMNVVPLNDHIVLERLEAEEKTAGGILLPDTAREKPRQGRVLSLGQGKRQENGARAPFQVKVGDRVLFSAYAGQEITLDGKEYLLMTEDDLLAILE
jgi:chaperonin GroES